MANRRTTILGAAAAVVVIGGAAAVMMVHRHPVAVTGALSPRTLQPTTSTPSLAGGPASAALKMPVTGKVASGYGWQYSGSLNEWYYNPGITISAKKGTPVAAAWSGEVIGRTSLPREGLTLTVRDGDGFETVYGNMGSASVKPGQMVKQGDVIGTVGGHNIYSRTPSAHLDFDVYHGASSTNPMSYLHPSS